MTRDEAGVLVVGQIARDLVLAADALPPAGGSATVRRRTERLGGKGANQAVGLRQLGIEHVDLVGVAGADAEGAALLEQARGDGIRTDGVVVRGSTALLVDVVVDGRRRLFEHVPQDARLTAADIDPARFARADTVILQLQQPGDALLAAATAARDAGARLVHDAGPAVAAVEVPGAGDLVAWRDGMVFLPFGDAPVVDPTGAGDAFVAGLVVGIRSGISPAGAGRLAAAAAAATVSRLGGRPDLAGVA